MSKLSSREVALVYDIPPWLFGSTTWRDRFWWYAMWPRRKYRLMRGAVRRGIGRKMRELGPRWWKPQTWTLSAPGGEPAVYCISCDAHLPEPVDNGERAIQVCDQCGSEQN